jgi:hypothetical protein
MFVGKAKNLSYSQLVSVILIISFLNVGLNLILNQKNKIASFYKTKISSWAGKAGANPSEAYFRCSTLGQALALLKNLTLGWKSEAGTCTPAY